MRTRTLSAGLPVTAPTAAWIVLLAESMTDCSVEVLSWFEDMVDSFDVLLVVVVEGVR